jgi:hypothetical protein
LINDSLVRARTVVIGPVRRATIERLRGTTLAGQSFGAHTDTGALSGSSVQAPLAHGMTGLPPASAALITFG